jgi:CTP-dependent riboflavin kinase
LTGRAPALEGCAWDRGDSFFERLSIQVKQQKKVKRTIVDSFETALRREGKHKGYIVAFSFSKVWGALIHPSRCVFADESAETIASEDVIRGRRADKP